MRILDDRYAVDIQGAVDDIIADLGLIPEESVAGLVLAVKQELGKMNWDVYGDALDEAIALLEDDDVHLEEED